MIKKVTIKMLWRQARPVFIVLLLCAWVLAGWPVKEARAASPTVQSRATGTANATTITVTLSGTPASGDLYVIMLQSQVNTVTWSQDTGTSGWVELADSNGQAIYYKQIGTSEPDPVFLQSTNTRSGYSVMQITGHEDPATQAPEVATQATGTSSNPNPPAITPTGGSKDYLFIVTGGNNDARRSYTGAPTNYANLNAFNTGGGPNGGAGATAERQLTASTEDPGTFTMDGSATWFANTIAVHPAAAGPDPTFTLNDYRWYVDSDSENVTDPWGVPDIAENTALTPLPAGNDPPSSSQELRLRVNFTVNTADLPATSQQFKLQYKVGTDADCTTGSWTDVGASQAWEFASSGVTDGTTLTALKLAASDVLGVYAKANPTATNPNGASTAQDIEYDFHIVGTNSAAATQYSFRVLESDGTVFDGYTTCPTLTTEPGTVNLLRHGNFFADQVEQGFFWAD